VFVDAPHRWEAWNANAQLELERIQIALNQIKESLEPGSQASH
jgi:hypothetical protein